MLHQKLERWSPVIDVFDFDNEKLVQVKSPLLISKHKEHVITLKKDKGVVPSSHSPTILYLMDKSERTKKFWEKVKVLKFKKHKIEKKKKKKKRQDNFVLELPVSDEAQAQTSCRDCERMEAPKSLYGRIAGFTPHVALECGKSHEPKPSSPTISRHQFCYLPDHMFNRTVVVAVPL